ncbi:putative carbonic anhydrase 3 isoform X3 [Diachasma alloeum]|uniref:putative carbonic anhydrase 3 isoform X3 n=1 Tax=Diachasma alloeum TaxID=454923 RepID=UPI0007384F7A|nr:putative carbonic anhydrase 3 isoform X3 [Diachasma alloeum]
MTLIHLIAFIFLTSGVHVSLQSDESSWTYSGENGPDNWGPTCTTGKHQSPIDIVSEDAIKDDLGSLKFIRYDFAYEGKLLNNGHSVQITLSGVPLFLNGGGLTSTYQFEQMHFHWGAEHTVDGYQDALELHLVHFEKKYGNASTAAQYKNGIVVIAVLFKLSDGDNKDLDPIVQATEMVAHWIGPSTAEIQHKIIPQLLLPKDTTSFYRYEGSLTTPGCQETVTWFIFTEKLTVSLNQLSVFQELETAQGPLKFNFRPVQPINDRKVYHHLLGYTSNSIIYTITNKFSKLFSLRPLCRLYHRLFSSFNIHEFKEKQYQNA